MAEEQKNYTVYIDGKPSKIYGTLSSVKKIVARRKDYSMDPPSVKQVNIGTPEAPLMVPEGSPAAISHEEGEEEIYKAYPTGTVSKYGTSVDPKGTGDSKKRMVNIGTVNAPLMVLEGSAAYENWKKTQTDIGTGDGGAGGDGDGGTGNIPDWLKDNEYFNQLSPDEQSYIVNYYNVLTIQDEESQKILVQALQDAKDQADPYFAEKIRMAQDELTRALGGQAGDFASNKRDLELRIDQIGEDLKTGKDRLSVDQQSELARQKRSYEYQLEGLVESASHKGLTFSSKRALAEGRLATEQTDIVESTKREFQRRITDLQQAASRGEVEAQNLLEDYERTYGESVTSLIRTSERYVGTSGLPDLPELEGVSPLGGVVGTMAEDKMRDIKQRADSLAKYRSIGMSSTLTNPFL